MSAVGVYQRKRPKTPAAVVVSLARALMGHDDIT